MASLSNHSRAGPAPDTVLKAVLAAAVGGWLLAAGYWFLLPAYSFLLPANWFLATAYGLLVPPCPPRQRDGHMAWTAEQSIVFQSAFAATVSDRDDVIGLPTWSRHAPRPSAGAIGHRRLRTRPLPVGLHDVEAANLTNAFVALFYLLTNVPGAASDLPFVNAAVAAECASGRFHGAAAPSADRFA